MFKKLFVFTLFIVSFSVAANAVRLVISSSNRIDQWTSRGNMLLEGVASDEKIYRVRVSCISADRNHAQGFAIGEMHLYKGVSHIGSKATFEYEDCLELYDGLKESELKLTLDWDIEGYEANSTGELIFSVENN